MLAFRLPPRLAAPARNMACQVYYELAAEREKREQQGEVAVVRVEQLAPFPFDLVMREMRRYPDADVMWCAQGLAVFVHALAWIQPCSLFLNPSIPLDRIVW